MRRGRLALISLEIPRAREPAIAEALGSLGGKLAARIGVNLAAAWFGRAVVIDAVGDTLTMQFPSKFIIVLEAITRPP